MHLNVGKEVTVLQRMALKELRAKFGEETCARNRARLENRIA